MKAYFKFIAKQPLILIMLWSSFAGLYVSFFPHTRLNWWCHEYCLFLNGACLGLLGARIFRYRKLNKSIDKDKEVLDFLHSEHLRLSAEIEKAGVSYELDVARMKSEQLAYVDKRFITEAEAFQKKWTEVSAKEFPGI